MRRVEVVLSRIDEPSSPENGHKSNIGLKEWRQETRIWNSCNTSNKSQLCWESFTVLKTETAVAETWRAEENDWFAHTCRWEEWLVAVFAFVPCFLSLSQVSAAYCTKKGSLLRAENGSILENCALLPWCGWELLQPHVVTSLATWLWPDLSPLSEA